MFKLILYAFTVSSFFIRFVHGQSKLCKTSCGDILIRYPFGIGDGCGSPYYRRLFVCSDSGQLELRTPSGRYPVKNLSYTDPHLQVSDPFMWKCEDGSNFRPTRPFTLDPSTHFTLSTQNDYLFFNCSPDDVIMGPKPMFCDRFPEQCDSTCDSSSYLCRHLPGCGSGLREVSCCSYYPKAAESLRLMLRHCATYAAVYWRSIGVAPPFDQVPEYGVRVDFEMPVTTRCLQCEDPRGGGNGVCGFDTQTQSFLCLCNKGNVTTFCNDPKNAQGMGSAAVAGTATAVSVAGAFGIGAGIWYLKKVRTNAPVTHGVVSNENRLF